MNKESKAPEIEGYDQIGLEEYKKIDRADACYVSFLNISGRDATFYYRRRPQQNPTNEDLARGANERWAKGSDPWLANIFDIIDQKIAESKGVK